MSDPDDGRPSDNDGPSPRLSKEEAEEVRHQTQMRPRVVYETVRADGKKELARPVWSLWWSGVAAGIGLSTSVFVQAILQLHLPDSPWTPLIESFGYCVGFIIVTLGRLQLFTESTLTAVLPVVAERTMRNLMLMLKLWCVVLAANFLGTALASLMAIYAGIASGPQLAAIYEVASAFAEKTPFQALMQGIPAGFFIAAMVWMLAASASEHLFIIIIMTYVISLGHLTHVVVGSAEMFLLIFSGQMSVWHGVTLIVPTLIGNIIGGTGLFGLLAYAQVRQEI